MVPRRGDDRIRVLLDPGSLVGSEPEIEYAEPHRASLGAGADRLGGPAEQVEKASVGAGCDGECLGHGRPRERRQPTICGSSGGVPGPRSTARPSES